MSDRLTLANAIEDAGIDRAKAERMASVIIDVIHDNVATKADVQAVRAEVQAVKADVQAVKADVRAVETGLRARIEAVETRLTARIDLVEHRLLTRLGGLAAVLTGLLFAAMRFWPPHG